MVQLIDIVIFSNLMGLLPHSKCVIGAYRRDHLRRHDEDPASCETDRVNILSLTPHVHTKFHFSHLHRTMIPISNPLLLLFSCGAIDFGCCCRYFKRLVDHIKTICGTETTSDNFASQAFPPPEMFFSTSTSSSPTAKRSTRTSAHMLSICGNSTFHSWQILEIAEVHRRPRFKYRKGNAFA